MDKYCNIIKSFKLYPLSSLLITIIARQLTCLCKYFTGTCKTKPRVVVPCATHQHGEKINRGSEVPWGNQAGSNSINYFPFLE